MSDNPFLADSIAAGGGVWGRPPAVPPPPTAPAPTDAAPPAASAAASSRDNPFAAEEDDAMFTMQPPSPKPLPQWAGGPSLPRGAALAAEARAAGGPPSPAPRPAPSPFRPSTRPASVMGVAESLYAGFSSDEVARELAARERALAAREAALQRRENEMAEALRRLKPHNWPRFFPLYYHDIEGEIPGPNQRMVRLGYAAWILAATGFCLNFLVLSVAFFGKGGSTNVATWFVAMLVSVCGLPGSWTFWYQALYRAAQTPAGLIAYARFFIHMSFHILFCIWMVLSLPKIGDWSAGIFRMISWFAAGSPKGTALGFLSIANIAVWGTCGLLSLAVLQQAGSKFRTGGGFAEMRRQKRAAQAAATIASRV